jgi:hypothetical protein
MLVSSIWGGGESKGCNGLKYVESPLRRAAKIVCSCFMSVIFGKPLLIWIWRDNVSKNPMLFEFTFKFTMKSMLRP